MDCKGRTVAYLLSLISAFSAATGFAVSVTNISVADTSLMEVAPGNNNGGQSWVLSGRTQNGPRQRALYRFDLTNIPTNAIVRSATLQLECTRQPGDMSAENSPFGLHRMYRAWGEGTNVALTNPGQGTPATPGEATWTHAFYPTNAWSTPGAASGADFSGNESSFAFVYGPDLSPYRFDTTPEMVADVQAWVNNPQTNFGWMLLCDAEDTIFTARRFNSREDTNSKPALEIEYMLPARIDRAQKIGNQFHLSFIALPGQTYSVEFRSGFSPYLWQPLADLGSFTETTRVLIVDSPIVTQRFYRVATH
jgi:hypothetical protein